jgi:hypothetical protein
MSLLSVRNSISAAILADASVGIIHAKDMQEIIDSATADGTVDPGELWALDALSENWIHEHMHSTTDALHVLRSFLDTQEPVDELMGPGTRTQQLRSDMVNGLAHGVTTFDDLDMRNLLEDRFVGADRSEFRELLQALAAGELPESRFVTDGAMQRLRDYLAQGE